MEINFIAVVVAGVAYMLLGAIWYSPILFGKSWMQGIGKTKEEVEATFSPMNYLWALVSSLLVAYGMARVMLWMDGTTIADGLKAALVAGICFVVATMGINDIFENKPKSLTLINVFYHFTGLILAGVIIGAW